jgi:sugar (pentulose or hexulose) kinase
MAMSQTYFLAIDSGTSVIKAVVFDAQGHEIAVERRTTPVTAPLPGYSEVPMYALWQLCAEVIRAVVAQVGREQIAAVGICGTACGFWPVDDHLRPARENAILWNDSRAAGVMGRWQQEGFYSRIFAETGNAPFPGYPLSLLRWLADHEPQTLDRTRWLLFNKDWMRLCLTGEIASDRSDVSYFPGDLEKREYHTGLLADAGLGELIEKLPPLLESDTVAGQVTQSAAEKTGLRPGTPVIAGAVDVVSSAVGGGAYRPGQAVSILGTSFLNSLVADAPSYIPAETGVQACMPGGVWIRSLVNTAGTICIDWMINTLAAAEKAAATDESDLYRRLEALAGESPEGARGLVFLPYLNTAGIVSPFADPHARGQFFGLSMSHTRADLIRAVYEGTALAMRDCYEAAPQPVEEIILVGGGARSAFWSQLFADVTGRPIIVLDGTESGARGMAIMSTVATGQYSDYHDATAAMVRYTGTRTPAAAKTQRYDAVYDLYRQLYLSGRSIWTQRAAIEGAL